MSLPALRHLLVAAILLGGIACFALAEDAAAAEDGAAAERRAFVRHSGPFWSWSGPATWSAAYGKQGITIVSGNGRHALDLGFSNTFCEQGNTVEQSVTRYFARQRRQLRQSGVRITSVSRIRRVRSLGQNYFRQIVRGTSNRGRNRGLAIFDYEVARYCYQRSVAMGAPSRGFGRSLRRLFRIFNSLAYFGPGHYEDGQGPHE